MHRKCSSKDVIKCDSCRGNHTAAYRGCTVRKQAGEIQQLKSERKITYAEAIKIYNSERRPSPIQQQDQDKLRTTTQEY